MQGKKGLVTEKYMFCHDSMENMKERLVAEMAPCRIYALHQYIKYIVELFAEYHEKDRKV